MKETTLKKHSKIKNFGKKRNVKPFTKDNQPPSDAKKAGWERRKKGMALVRTILALNFNGLPGAKLRKKVAQFFGVPENDLTVEDMLHFQQAIRAIKSGDTNAYKALLEKSGNFKTELSLTAEVNQNVKMTLKDLPTEKLEQMLELFSQSKQKSTS
jgi:hypothetical protein